MLKNSTVFRAALNSFSLASRPFYNTGPRRLKYMMYMFIIVILLERTQKSFVSKYYLLSTYK